MTEATMNGDANSNTAPPVDEAVASKEEVPSLEAETSTANNASAEPLKEISNIDAESSPTPVEATTTTTTEEAAAASSSSSVENGGVVLREWSYAPGLGPLDETTTAKNEAKSDDEMEDDDAPLEHKFAPGDHVIRWEMLPIVWPIQIHGIVLSVGKEYVKLVDFGLTTKSANQNGNQPPSEPDHLTIQQSPSRSEDENVNDNIIMASWKKIQPKEKEKKRIHVRIITDRKELRKWQKVHYGSGLFGMGGEEEYGNNTSNRSRANSSDGLEPANSATGSQSKTPNWLKWGRGGGGKKVSPDSNKMDDNQSQATDVTEDDAQDDPKLLAEAKQMTASIDGSARQNGNHDPSTQQQINENNDTNSSSLKKSNSRGFSLNNIFQSQKEQDPEKVAQASFAAAPPPRKKDAKRTSFFTGLMTQQNKDGNNTNDKDSSNSSTTGIDDSTSSARMRVQNFCDSKLKNMNPAMARLLEESKKKLTPNKKAKEEAEQQDGGGKKTNKLPKSDPPKLVLARATFLLEKGETVLPTYHVFHCNSECIAVFCKTGVWSTLQSAVFLHSCSIGNAKSATALTLGAMAAAPLMGVAIGAAGIAAVGAPWLILKNSNDKCHEYTQHLTDLFWQQAKNDVFVECIEHWSGILDDDNDKDEEEEVGEEDEQKEQKLIEQATAKTEEKIAPATTEEKIAPATTTTTTEEKPVITQI